MNTNVGIKPKPRNGIGSYGLDNKNLKDKERINLLRWNKLFARVSKEKYWYTPILEVGGDTTLRMKQVLMDNIKLEENSENNKLPKGCNKKKVK